MFINDLPSIFDNTVDILLFADDAKIFYCCIYTESYKRVDVWTDTIFENETGADKLRKLKKIGATKWNSADDALRSIFNTWSDPGPYLREGSEGQLPLAAILKLGLGAAKY
jgi:hypothetical protein